MEKYEAMEMEIIEFDTIDVITTSEDDGEIGGTEGD